MIARSFAKQVAEGVLATLPRRTGPGDRLILAYHNVVPSRQGVSGDRSLHLAISDFEAQLQLLQREADVVPLMDLLQRAAPAERRVAITFDDAYASALQLGVGACVAAGMPCTVFVAPGLLSTVPAWDQAALRGEWSDSHREHFLWQLGGRASEGQVAEGHAAEETTLASLRIGSEEQLRLVAQSRGVTFGNHTMHHPNLGALSAQECQQEISDAAVWLERHFPRQLIPVIAYPYGISPQVPKSTLREAREAFGLMVSGGWMPAESVIDALATPRWNVPAGVSAHGFLARIRGWLS